MNRPLVMTLLAMVASVAAAVATPEVDAAPRADCADGKGMLPPLSSPTLPVRRQAEAPVAPCSAAVDDPYLRWHHGSLKLMPACAAAAQT